MTPDRKEPVPCDCLNYCGDDPWLKSGKARPCAEKVAKDKKHKARTTLADRINKLVARHGSLRNVAKITGIDPAYLSRLRSGKKIWPGDDVVRRLGLKRVIEYEEIVTLIKSEQLSKRTMSG